MTLTQRQIARVKKLEDAHGRVTPGRVVADAKAKTSPLHTLFEWDRDKAANRYWLHRAREIIGSVQVVVVNETTTIRTPYYVRDPEAAGGQGYSSVVALRANPASARESLIYTLEVAAGHLRRALDLAGPLGLASEVDELLSRITGLQRVARSEEAA